MVIFSSLSLISFADLNPSVARFFARFIIIVVFEVSFIAKSSFLKEVVDVTVNEIFFNINK